MITKHKWLTYTDILVLPGRFQNKINRGFDTRRISMTAIFYVQLLARKI